MTMIPNAYGLPADMVLLPDGQEMPVKEFFRRYSTTICQYQNAKIAVTIPAHVVGDDVTAAMKGSVGFLTGWLFTLLFPESVAGKALAAGAGAYVGNEVATRLSQLISTQKRVKVIKVKSFMECQP